MVVPLHFTENIIITGDLNVDLLTQTNHKLNEIMTLYDLTNVINEPTWVHYWIQLLFQI